ncbi:catalase [bacterium]|nr:catalase [bacterium]
MKRLTFAALAGLAAVIAASAPAPLRAEDGGALVADLNSVFGAHHVRAVHAYGIVTEGSFTPSAEAGRLSSAAIFAGPKVPLVARFSNFAPVEGVPDTDPSASPRGLALRLSPAEGATVDLVTHSYNGFPVKTADDFGALFRAIAASGPGAAKPTPLDAFLKDHPKAALFLTGQAGPPESYGTLAYFGVNAEALVAADGTRTIFRTRIVPAAGVRFLDAAALAKTAPVYLRAELADRFAKGPVSFDWMAEIAQAGDPTDDPSSPWPEGRKLVRLGTFELLRIAPDEASLDHDLMFQPGALPPGLEPVDPMLTVRDEAYAVSASDRQ